MAELESAAGVGRETIRYYVRLGLVPQPRREGRTRAVYGPEHLARLVAIRRLREERRLPLAVIAAMLDHGPATEVPPEGARWLSAMDRLLHQRLDALGGRERVSDIVAGWERPPDPAELAAIGLVEPAPDGTVSARDARILRILGALARLGFDRGRGYAADTAARYVQLMRWLAREEAREFFEKSRPAPGDRGAAEAASRAVELLNELLAELHTREILALLSEPQKSPDTVMTGPEPGRAVPATASR